MDLGVGVGVRTQKYKICTGIIPRVPIIIRNHKYDLEFENRNASIRPLDIDGKLE
jgi:hypothetical protein